MCLHGKEMLPSCRTSSTLYIVSVGNLGSNILSQMELVQQNIREDIGHNFTRWVLPEESRDAWAQWATQVPLKDLHHASRTIGVVRGGMQTGDITALADTEHYWHRFQRHLEATYMDIELRDLYIILHHMLSARRASLRGGA